MEAVVLAREAEPPGTGSTAARGYIETGALAGGVFKA